MLMDRSLEVSAVGFVAKAVLTSIWPPFCLQRIAKCAVREKKLVSRTIPAAPEPSSIVNVMCELPAGEESRQRPPADQGG